MSSYPLADPKPELFTPYPALVIGRNRLIGPLLQSPAGEFLRIGVIPRVLGRSESLLVECFLGCLIHVGGGRGKKLDDEIGVFAALVPNRPVLTRSFTFHSPDKEEVRPLVILFLRLAPTVINERVAAGKKVVSPLKPAINQIYQ